VVMVADINSYSPFIQAVFGSAAAERHIPFSISDRSATQESPLLQSFLALLRLPNARFGAGELLAILEVPAVLRRFELDDEEFNQLRVWVQETGIRWGLDDGYPERFELPRLSGNSWLFGLRRMLLGFAMGDGEPVAGILPYADIEGQQGLALGKLAWFVDSLAEFLPRLQQAQPLGEWLACLNALLERFYLADEDEERQLQLIRSQLADWLAQLGEARFEQPISADLLQDYLGSVLGESRSSQRFLAGQVNFCTLMPMRSIPFKQVCLLGMNDGVYPRTLPPMGFDLMAVAGRRGDRSRRDDDRYLFLEALLSAQQGLYISYQGFSAQDNSDKVPSVLLAELIDYVRQGFVLAGDEQLDDESSGKRLLAHLITQHPLTPYSHAYFYPAAGSGLFTYAADWLPALHPQRGAANFQSGELPLPPEWGKEQGLELAELLRFYRQPARYFLNRRLKVWFELNEANIEESEPFELDGLQHYQLKDLLLDAHLAQGDSAVRRERLQLTGLLPQGWFGSLLLEDLDERDGQAGGSAAALGGGQTGGGDRHRPGPGAAARVDRHPEGTIAGGQTRQLQRQGSAAGLDPAPLPLIERRPRRHPAVRCQTESAAAKACGRRGAAQAGGAGGALDAGDEAAAAVLPEHRLGLAQGDREGSGETGGGRQGGSHPLQRWLHGQGGGGRRLCRPLFPGTRRGRAGPVAGAGP